jgi:hypothetical protein
MGAIASAHASGEQSPLRSHPPRFFLEIVVTMMSNRPVVGGERCMLALWIASLEPAERVTIVTQLFAGGGA